MISSKNQNSFGVIGLISPFKTRFSNQKFPNSKLCNIFMLLVLLLLAPVAAAKQVKIIMYGDSISAGYGMTTQESWPYLLNETFKAENSSLQIINESISGETTGGGLARLENVLKRHKPGKRDWLLIELGGNDGLRGFPVKTSKSNLNRMIEIAKSFGVKVAIMQVRIPPNYGARYTRMFEGMYPDLAEQHQLPLVPFFMEQVATNPNYMLPDGIHPNVSAQIIIRDFMKPELEKLAAM